MRVVIDTSVLISAFLFPKSKPALIYEQAKRGKFELYLSQFILQEFFTVLNNKFKIEAQKIIRQIRRFQKIAKIVSLRHNVRLIKENISDNHILETALNVKADYLITGDKKHILPLKKVNSTRIVSPAEFLDFIK